MRNPLALISKQDNDTCTLSEAKKQSDWPKFAKAMKTEIKAHEENLR